MTDTTSIERRAVSDSAGIVAVIGLVSELHKDVKALDAKLDIHMVNETHELAAEIAKLMLAAFPNGDATGHRAAHDEWIRKTRANAEFWEKMRYELTRWGLFGFLGWALYALWEAFLKGPHK